MPSEIAMKSVVYRIPGMDRTRVRPGVEYAPGLTMDLYYPPNQQTPLPAVIYVLGYRDVGFQTPFGCQFRETQMCISWSQLFAASAMIGITYETRDPVNDIETLLCYLRSHAVELNLDATRIGIYSSSGNVPVALSVALTSNIQCAVLCYGFMFDLDGSTAVSGAASQFHFANPSAGRTVDDLPRDTSLLLVRAGHEQFAGLNQSIDNFISHALRLNLPVALINHSTGPHAFDLFDDSAASRNVIRAILAFFQSCLSSSSTPPA